MHLALQLAAGRSRTCARGRNSSPQSPSRLSASPADRSGPHPRSPIRVDRACLATYLSQKKETKTYQRFGAGSDVQISDCMSRTLSVHPLKLCFLIKPRVCGFHIQPFFFIPESSRLGRPSFRRSPRKHARRCASLPAAVGTRFPHASS